MTQIAKITKHDFICRNITHNAETEQLLTGPGCSDESSAVADTFRSQVRQSLRKRTPYPPELTRAMEGVKFIADHMKEEDKEEQVGVSDCG